MLSVKTGDLPQPLGRCIHDFVTHSAMSVQINEARQEDAPASINRADYASGLKLRRVSRSQGSYRLTLDQQPARAPTLRGGEEMSVVN